MGTRPELEILLPDPPARVAHLGSAVLIDVAGLMPEVHGDPNHEILAAIDAAAETGEIAMFCRVRNSRPPPPGTREQLLSRMTELHEQVRCVVFSLEDAGFRGVAFRSFISAARLLHVVKLPIEVFGDLDRARVAFTERARPSPSHLASIDQFFADGDAGRP